MLNKLTDTKEIAKALSWLTKYWGRPVHPQYLHARTVDEAVSLLLKHGAGGRIVAGGIDLVGLMKRKALSPAPVALIDIKTVPGLKFIRETADGLTIGALTLVNDLERSEPVRDQYSVLWQAARSIGSPQIRNMSTVAGNLLQDVRCWYYRRPYDTGLTYHCRRKTPEGPCYAADGENQYHAVVGSNVCCAVGASDLATVLVALGASVQTVDADGGREIPVAELYTPLGNTLRAGEIVTSLHIPRLGRPARQRFLKFRLRKAIDFAIVSAAAVLQMDGDVVCDARIVLGGVAPAPYRASQAEEYLIGRPLDEDVAERAAGLALALARPSGKNAYKVQIAEALAKRAILGQDE